MLKTMTDRFDLESEMIDCWNVVEDLKTVYYAEISDTDQMSNALLGLITLYDLKFNKMFKTFETCIVKGEVK